MKRFSRLTLAGLALATATAVRADDSESDSLAQQRSVLYRAATSGKANAFSAAVLATSLVEPLRTEGPLTLLVPTDEAFAKLPEETLRSLLSPENEDQLESILKYHVIPKLVTSSEITRESRPKTLNGDRLTIAANDHGIAINNATVVEADIRGRNGVVHFIDAVLVPPTPDLVETAEKAGEFQVLLKALKATGLDKALASGDFTVLAPTDDAFAELGHDTLESLLKPDNRDKLTAILKYHVLPGKVSAREAVAAGRSDTLQGNEVKITIKGGRLVINESKVEATDIEASNGIIHVIDRVLIPADH